MSFSTLNTRVKPTGKPGYSACLRYRASSFVGGVDGFAKHFLDLISLHQLAMMALHSLQTPGIFITRDDCCACNQLFESSPALIPMHKFALCSNGHARAELWVGKRMSKLSEI